MITIANNTLTSPTDFKGLYFIKKMEQKPFILCYQKKHTKT